MQNQTSKTTNRQVPRGFTLIEVLIATLLIGLAIVALMTANGTLSMANGVGTDMSTAEFLAEQIRELTAMLPVVDPETALTTFGPEEGSVIAYDDVDDFDDATFSPPIGANRAPLAAFAGFSQQVTVRNVNRSNLDAFVGDHLSEFVQVKVSVLQNGREITSSTWVRARY